MATIYKLRLPKGYSKHLEKLAKQVTNDNVIDDPGIFIWYFNIQFRGSLRLQCYLRPTTGKNEDWIHCSVNIIYPATLAVIVGIMSAIPILLATGSWVSSTIMCGVVSAGIIIWLSISYSIGIKRSMDDLVKILEYNSRQYNNA